MGCESPEVSTEPRRGSRERGAPIPAGHVDLSDEELAGGGTCYEDGGGYSRTLQEYDGMGRIWRISNPLRTGTPVWTTMDYDGLGRLTQVT